MRGSAARWAVSRATSAADGQGVAGRPHAAERAGGRLAGEMLRRQANAVADGRRGPVRSSCAARRRVAGGRLAGLRVRVSAWSEHSAVPVHGRWSGAAASGCCAGPSARRARGSSAQATCGVEASHHPHRHGKTSRPTCHRQLALRMDGRTAGRTDGGRLEKRAATGETDDAVGAGLAQTVCCTARVGSVSGLLARVVRALLGSLAAAGARWWWAPPSEQPSARRR